MIEDLSYKADKACLSPNILGAETQKAF